MALDVGRITESETADAIGVLARGMRDNPIHVAALGDDPGHRVHALTQLFSGMIPMQPEPLRAREGGEVVGVCGFLSPPECMVHAFGGLPADQFPPMLEDAGEQARLVEWMQAWGARDPDEPHFHLGPVAADAGQQGRGIGSALMRAFCERVDRDHALAYLETDKAENVGFYERFGFETVAKADVIGVPNWFMRREVR
jgi:ribosomal protein S18 acetylase RimI-like enzyme